MQKTAFVFSGQGAQFAGMGKDLAGSYPECSALFSRANEALGFDLAKLCFEGPIEELTKSDNCQPAIFLTSAACRAALRKLAPGVMPACVAGLSLGEWSALYAADALSFEDALKVLRARGRFMQQACEERQGGMVSVIGLGMPEIEKVCAVAGVQIANLNSPEQTVLSGEKARIHEAGKLAQAAGAKKTVVLNVAGAFHSALMASAAGRLEQFLGAVSFQRPAVPAVANVTGRPHGAPAEIPPVMVKQVTSPVRWVDTVLWMKEQGVQTYVECGPGKVLSGLIKRIDKHATVHNIQDCPTLEKTVAALLAG